MQLVSEVSASSVREVDALSHTERWRDVPAYRAGSCTFRRRDYSTGVMLDGDRCNRTFVPRNAVTAASAGEKTAYC